MKHTVGQEISGVVTLVAVIWLSFIADWLLPVDLTAWGIAPRSGWGLVGIPLSPFIHANLSHLLSNTVPLVILLTLMAGSRAGTWASVAEIILLSGGLLWLFGRSTGAQNAELVHVGASGLIYGLIAFLIVAGFREKRLVPLGVALLVGFLYGSTLVFGVLPTAGPHVSWDGHLFGAIAGGLLGYINVNREKEPTDELEPLT